MNVVALVRDSALCVGHVATLRVDPARRYGNETACAGAVRALGKGLIYSGCRNQQDIPNIRVCVSTTNHQAAKVAGSSIPGTMVAVGETGTRVSFEDWLVPVNVQDNSTIVVAVTTFGFSEPAGAIEKGATYLRKCAKRLAYP